MSMISHRAGRAALLGLALGGCLDFRGVGPEDPPQVSPPKTVRVTIEYTRPSDCVLPCDGPVTFAASWMRPGAEFPLVSDETTLVYRGVALNVPINYPPHGDDQPYTVRVFDGSLPANSTGGYTALRLKVGGESLNSFQDVGTPKERGDIFIDEHGAGHNPF
jgi:hypothetical protein